MPTGATRYKHKRGPNIEPKSFPMCFQSMENYRSYLIAARQATGSIGHFCKDCLPRYQEQMMMRGLCEHPEVSFVITDDHGIEGVRYGQRKPKSGQGIGRHHVVAS